MATEEEIKNMKKTLDNTVLRKQIMGTARKKSVKREAQKNCEVDSDYDEFEYNFLKNWNKLEKVPEVYNEIKDLSEEDKKNKIEELKEKFAANIVDSQNYKKGYEYADQYRNMWKSRIKTKFNK